LLQEAHRCNACRQILNDKTQRSVSAFSHTAEGLRLLSVMTVHKNEGEQIRK